MMRPARLLPLLLLPALSACVGDTGGDLFEFSAVASGPPGLTSATYSFQNGQGYAVTLQRARLHVGAMYLNRSVATSVAEDTSCTLAGIYVAEVTSSNDVDLLSPEPQPFPELGNATSDLAHTGEVWLMGADVNDPSDGTVILDVAGTASKAGETFPFEAELSIGSNRVVKPSNDAQPGAKPICKQRIVSPISAEVRPRRGGQLSLEIDPAAMFANVDFTTLEADDDGIFHFDDEGGDQASINLYAGLRSTAAFRFAWK